MFHYKLTRRRRPNLFNITGTILWPSLVCLELMYELCLIRKANYIVIYLFIEEFPWLIAWFWKGIVVTVRMHYRKIYLLIKKTRSSTANFLEPNQGTPSNKCKTKASSFFNDYGSAISEDIWINKNNLETLHNTGKRKKNSKNTFWLPRC